MTYNTVRAYYFGIRLITYATFGGALFSLLFVCAVR